MGVAGLGRVEELSGRLDRARTLLAEAERILVLTGAGISQESGVPTFRGAAGLWKSFRPEELATPEAFQNDPVLVWQWYAWRRALVARCAPHAGHRALARLALSHDGTTLVTQNVDGLHRRAAREEAGPGEDPHRAHALELHGALDRDLCTGCGRRAEGSSSLEVTGSSSLPRCPACGEIVRPDVTWFGEALDPGVLGRASEAAAQADVCLVVGTSAVVHPAASLPLSALERGGTIVEVNVEATGLTRFAEVSLLGRAGEILPRLGV